MAHQRDYCFACGARLYGVPRMVDTRDNQIVAVGPRCAKLVAKAGDAGYQPPKGGPRLYPLKADAA